MPRWCGAQRKPPSPAANATRLYAARSDHERAILIAPPVGMLDFSGAPGGLEIDAIAGDRDDFVDTEKLQALDGVTAHIISGADHFFSGYHAQLADALSAII